jgi:glycerophosphoryl diester phosphodiesterase
MALDAGADGVEFDVRLARDGVPVVFHDETLLRTARRKERLANLTSVELSEVDVGSWFNSRFPHRARPEFSRESVRTLRQILRQLRGFGGRIYVELKCGDRDFEALTGAVADVVRDDPLRPQIVVKSFKLATIPKLRHLLPDVTTAALFAPDVMHFLRRRKHIILLAKEFGADQISVHHSLVTRRLTELADSAGMPLIVWTVDDPKWLRRRPGLHIDALITNDPAIWR